MGLVDSWLEGIGLGYAVPIFAGQGINSPDMLSALDVVDFPELGISDQNDRKKVNRSYVVACSLISNLLPGTGTCLVGTSIGKGGEVFEGR